MCNRLTIKATKFQQSSANRFWAVAKKLPREENSPPPPPYKLGLRISKFFSLIAMLCAELSQREMKMSFYRIFFNLNVPKTDPLSPSYWDNFQFCWNLQIRFNPLTIRPNFILVSFFFSELLQKNLWGRARVKTNFTRCSCWFDQKFDGDFFVTAWNLANNNAALANCTKIIYFFSIKCPPGMKNEAVGNCLKKKWIQRFASCQVHFIFFSLLWNIC